MPWWAVAPYDGGPDRRGGRVRPRQPKRRPVRRAAGSPPVELARERRIRGKLGELAALLEGGALNPDRTRAYLAGELEAAPMDSDDETTLMTSIRLPVRLLAVMDELAAGRAAVTGERASRSAMLRLAIERGAAMLVREAAVLGAPDSVAALLAELETQIARADVQRAEMEALRERVATLAGGPAVDEDSRAHAMRCVDLDLAELARREAAGVPLGERLQSLRDSINAGRDR